MMAEGNQRSWIAVIGLGCRFPGAANPTQFWENLVAGVDAVGPAPEGRGLQEHGGFLPDVASFSPRRFGLSAAEAAMMDPQQRLALEVAMDALDDAMIAPEALAGTAAGVYVGVSSADYAQLTLRDAGKVDAYTNAGAAASVIANRLSYLLDLRGPSLVMDTACSSSLVAVQQACRDLRDGLADVALAGGVNVILSPAVAAGFHAAQATSPDARCMAFDARANGMVRGEGCGVVVLKRLADARRDGDRIHAVILGGAVNQDGRTNGLTAPNRQGQEALLRMAYRQAGVDPATVTAVETHGTGTPLGDPIEAAALTAVLGADRPRPLILGAVKSNLGHLEAAAGVAGLIKAILALRHRTWPTNLHFTAPNPHIDMAGLQVPVTPEPLEEDAIVGVSAFGFGGTNAHIVLAPSPLAGEVASCDARPEGADVPQILFLSAKSPDLLPPYAAAVAKDLTHLPARCATAAHRRHAHRSRLALVFTTPEELEAQLLAPPEPHRAPVRAPKLCFVLPGMGSQQPGMGRELLAEPAFRAAVEACDAAMHPHLGWSVLAEMQAADPQRQARGDVAQPLVFALQVGLAALMASWGVRPDAVVGASLGEIAAAYLAGALTLEQAAKVVCRRSAVMMERAGEGGMAVAGVAPAQAEALLAAHAGKAWVAAHNAPEQVLVAGELPALEALIAELETQQRFGRIVKGAQVASHSPMVEPLREPLFAALGRIEAGPARLKMVSTVEARVLADELLDEAYWWRNMREPVRFAPAIAALEAEVPHVYLELSAHPSMTTAIAACGPAKAAGALRRGRPERVAVREAVGTLWGWGVALDLAALVPPVAPLPLPPIPWPRERCWVGEAPMLEAVVAKADGLDRSALLALPPNERRGALVTALRAHVAKVLGLAPGLVDVEEPLTSLGVGSLMGMELNNRLERELGVRLPVARLLAGPSVATIADEALAQLAGEGSAVIPVGPAEPTAPMSPAQRRLYFLARLAPDAAAYNIPAAVELEGPLDVSALARALDAVVSRHAALRTSFVPTADGEAMQAIAPYLALDLPVLDLRAVPEAEREAEARAVAADEARQPFDLANGPLLRALVLRLDGRRHWLLVTLHHLVADGWSLGLLLRELAAAYQAALAGRPPALPPLAVQYADYARWQLARGDQQEHLAFWRERLAGAPPLLALPTDRPRAPEQRFRGAVAGTYLDPALVAAVEALAKKQQATPFMVLYAAFAAWLARAAGQEDLVVGTPIAGRDHPGLEPLIGFFLNTLPLRLSTAGDPAFTALLARARATVIEAFEHQDLPFERLVEALALERGGGHAPVFQVVLALHAPMRGARVGDLALQPLEIDHGTAKYDLTAAFLETDAGLRCAFEYDADLFDAATVEGWLAQFQALLAGAVAAPDAPVSALPLLAPAAEAELLALGQGPALEIPPGPWWAPIAERARTHPDLPAVQDAHETLTYGQLHARAMAIAASLPPGGAPVAVQLPRSAAMVAAWLGAAYAGAPYLPLDPDAPPARLDQILEDARPAAILRSGEAAPATFTPVVGETAYLIYTSGTTGRPKGVAIPNQGLAALIAWHRQAYAPGPGDRVAQVANPAFDAATWEVWPALAAGATVVIPPSTSPQALKAALVGVTQAFVPTALLEAMLADPWPAPPGLVLTGGDRLTRRPPPGLRLVNHYGPTEASVVATAGEVDPEGEGLPSIGRPIAGAVARILDDQGRLVPRGLPGELCVGGPGLAHGYWRDPALTASRFVTAADGTRLYRTGDRARWRADGTLEFLGRLDDQVSVRGVRVEPAEVAAALREHPAVEDAFVAHLPEHGLVAYLAGPADAREAVRAFARTRLPAAFVPAAWAWLPALPMSAHGKLDRAALPVPQALEATWEAPQGELEEAIAALFADALGVARVGRHDDFFALGGHSLLALRLADQLRARLGLEPNMRALFLHPTPAALATQLAPAAVAPVLRRGDPAQAFPLTEVQEAYWVGRQAAGVSAHAYVEFEPADLDLEALQRALDALVARHPQLRAIVTSDGRQQVLAQVPPFPLAIHDLRGRPDQAARLAALRAELDHAVRPSDRWPLFDVVVARLDERRCRLHLGFDALIADAASLGILARELGALLQGDELPPAPALSFQDYVLTAREVAAGPAGERARAYWRERLAELPPAPILPAGEPLPGAPRFERLAGGLAADRWEAFQARAREAGVAPAAGLLAAFAAVLGRFARSPRFTLNLTRFDRRPWHPDVDRLVGDFTALSLLEVEAAPGPFREAARGLQARLWEDLDHPDAGGVWALRELARLRGPMPMPVVFTGVLDQDLAAALPAALGEPGFGSSQTPQVDLDHQAMLRHGALVHQWDVRAGAYPPGMAEAMFTAYEDLLARLSATSWGEAFDALPGNEAVLAYNDVQAAPPADTLWGAFARQALATPDAPAVLAGEVALTYAEVDREARVLAGKLVAGGILPGDRVAIAMDKGWEPVVAALGVLAAGAAYVPIDPAAPEARRRQLVAATGCKRVLVQPGGLEGMVLARTTAPAPEVPGPGELAYVIFTSGSTGTPKGVMITHQAAMGTVAEVNRRWQVGPADRVLALSALGFDLSVYDLFGPLAVGGAVVMPPPGSQRDPDAWLETMTRHAVTIWNSVPALMALLLARLDGAPGPADLRLALLSGDWVPVDLPDRVRGAWAACEVVALGGATEAAIWSICQPCPPDAPWPAVPYGRPLAGQAFHVLDDHLRPRPVGVPGELYIAGNGLAAGYWDDPVRTAERFLQGLDGTRLYRTGDWGRWAVAPDGGLVIEFLGREDQQVKILGQRVELGEIEAALATCPGVTAAAVVAVGPARGEKHLVGFLTPASADPAAAEAHLRERLPAGMVPRAWRTLDTLPLTPNGKVDRKALVDLASTRAPAPAGAAGDVDRTTALALDHAAGMGGAQLPAQGAGQLPARGEAQLPARDEAQLLALVADVLARPDLTADADLLALGVNSIDLVRLANRLEAELGHRPDLADMFGLRTVRDLAAYYATRHVTPTQPSVQLEPAQREAFKQALRTRPSMGPTLPLAGTPSPTDRESARGFAPEPIPAAALGELLARLAAHPDGKRGYASAGALYAVQTYLHARNVAGLPTGLYAYDPTTHALAALAPGLALPDLHYAQNVELARHAAFDLFLVAAEADIRPIYGDWWQRFALLEAGAMAQLLAEAAPARDLALCPIGHLAFERVRPHLGLDGEVLLAHALVGGAPDAWEVLTL